MSEFVKLGKTNVVIDGRFKLEVKTDIKKFSLTNINSFVPVGKKVTDKMRFLTESGETDTLFIDRASILFNPKKLYDNHNISVLIQHPNVYIGGMNSEEHMKLVREGYKVDNPKFTITNVDKVDDDKYKKEVKLIKVRARLYDDKNPLSLEKLIWIASNFGLSYRTDITEESRRVNELIKKLDKYVQESIPNAEKLLKVLDNMKETEMTFYINELIRLKIIEEFSGVYKIDDRPVGGGIDHVIIWYEQNAIIYAEHQKLVRDRLKEENVLNN
jgi:hypothetical protein